MELEVSNKITKEEKDKEIEKFANELGTSLSNNVKKEVKEKNNIQEIDKKSEKYWKYWIGTLGQDIKDKAVSEVALSRKTYNQDYAKLVHKVEDVLREMSKKEGTFYYKPDDYYGKARWDEELQQMCYYVDRYRDGKKRSLKVPKVGELYTSKKTSGGFIDKYEYEDVIFTYNQKGMPKVRDDLKEKAIELTIKEFSKLKKEQDLREKEYRKEGHIYNAIDEGEFITIKDVTQRRVPIEDMKFSINEYKGNGKYQVINGEYKKIGELIKRKSKEEKKRDDIIESIENTVEELKEFEEKEMKKQIALVDKRIKEVFYII